MKRLLLVVVLTLCSIGVYGVAQAGGSGTANTTPSKAPAPPLAVPGTAAGMPATAQDAGFAVVARTGVRVRQFRTVSSARLALGQYEVIFAQPVNGCAHGASIGDTDAVGVEAPGEITVTNRNANVNGVFITTHDSAGGLADRSFHLWVHC